jgi:ABC transporter substrate binding protein (PQQ-dependent alcohol dehydrogenase system)
LRVSGTLPLMAAMVALGLVGTAFNATAQTPAAAPAELHIGYLGSTVQRPALPDYMDPFPADEGIQGAKLAIADNMTTGRFTKQSFILDEAIAPEGGDVVQSAKTLFAKGDKLVVADLAEADLLKVTALPEAAGVTFFNVQARDDDLRAGQCRANILHTIPSRAMLADGLSQYLLAKKWKSIFLVSGLTPADQAYAAAIRNSAHKFQLKLAADKPWTYDPGARTTDTGHYDVESEVARFTQGTDYDIMVVADEEHAFDYELSHRGTLARPVAGTIGLTPTSWGRPFEQWGAIQGQQRFLKIAKRWMTERDYAAWLAVRTIGEAATQAKSVDPAELVRFIHSDPFQLGGYKGAKLSYRSWDGQLRQPILLIDAYSLVSVSPQPGFLHQFSELDTLGVDKPETKCVLK